MDTKLINEYNPIEERVVTEFYLREVDILLVITIRLFKAEMFVINKKSILRTTLATLSLMEVVQPPFEMVPLKTFKTKMKKNTEYQYAINALA